jgi:hypothetical protein
VRNIPFAAAIVVLTSAASLAGGQAGAQALSPDSQPSADSPSAPAATPARPAASLPADQSPQSAGLGTTTPIRAVSLRSGPNTGSPVIGTLRPGMSLRIIATGSYGWLQVESPVGSGWAYGPGYLAGGSAAENHSPESHGPLPAIDSP